MMYDEPAQLAQYEFVRLSSRGAFCLRFAVDVRFFCSFIRSFVCLASVCSLLLSRFYRLRDSRMLNKTLRQRENQQLTGIFRYLCRCSLYTSLLFFCLVCIGALCNVHTKRTLIKLTTCQRRAYKNVRDGNERKNGPDSTAFTIHDNADLQTKNA